MAGLLAEFIEPDPDYTYGGLLPMARHRETGDLRPAVPGAVRSTIRGLLDLINMRMTPDAMMALPMMAAPGVAPAGALASNAALRTARTLPMDEASRIARAAEQGRTATGFHGTADDIAAFGGPTWIADDPRAASYYADRAAARKALDARNEGNFYDEVPELDELNPYEVLREAPQHNIGQNVTPLRYNPGKQLDMTELGDAPDPRELWDWLVKRGVVEATTDEDFDEFVLPELTTESPTLWKMIEDWGLEGDIGRAGYDSIRIQDTVTAKGGGWRGQQYGHDAVLVLDPQNIRSRFAAFDPEKKDSADLLASRPGIPVGGLLEEEEPQRHPGRGWY